MIDLKQLNNEALIQEQLDAYNNKDVERFARCFAEDVTIYMLDQITQPNCISKPFIQGRDNMATYYQNNRFNHQKLHAELVHRTLMGNKVIDHEKVIGITDETKEIIAIYQVEQHQIVQVCFVSP